MMPTRRDNRTPRAKGRTGSFRAAGLALAAVLCTIAAPAHSGTLEISYTVHDDHLHVAFDLGRHLPKDFLERVDSGLTAVLLIETEVLPISIEGAPLEPRAGALKLRCETRYDLWSETYALSLTDAGGRREIVVEDRESALQGCARPPWLPLVAMDELDLRRRYVVRVVLDADPDRPQARARAREYLGDPGRGGAERSGGRSLFGTVAQALFRQRSEENTSIVMLRGIPFGEPLLSQALAAAERMASDEAAPARPDAGPPVSPPEAAEGEEEEE